MLSRLFLPLLCLIVFSPQAKAQAPVADILEAAPWGFYTPRPDGSRQLSGLWAPVVKQLQDRTGITIQTRLSPYARVLRNLATGRADLTVLIRSKRLDGAVVYAGKCFDLATVVVAKPGLAIDDLKHLEGKKVGVLRGLPYPKEFDQNPQIEKIEVRSYEVMVQMFLADRLDYIAGPNISLAHHLNQQSSRIRTGKPLILERAEVWLQISAKSPLRAQAPLFEKAVNDMRQEGFFEDLLKHQSGELWQLP
ncbi:MAG: transporter substrate-binding domain-containing protein [bacterium]|nr:transporter substrate-binding domain-containing protein [bacterium]